MRKDGSLNLDWPKYAGLQLETVKSIGNMKGKIYVSRSGSPSGNTIGYGDTVESWYASNSQRAIPSSTSEIQVGIMDVDKYKNVIEIISSNVKNSIIKEALLKEGFSAEQSLNLIAESSRFIFTLIENAKLYKLGPYEYLIGKMTRRWLKIEMLT